MKRDLFCRYVWLLDIVRHGNRPTYEAIANAWLESPLNEDGSPLALRTFHNHREAIEHLFGIRILCNRSDHNRYYIADDENQNTQLKIWMLQTLSNSNTIHRQSSLQNRILLDTTPEEKYGLLSLIEAMKREKCVDIVYSVPNSNGKTSFRIAPYCVRFWKNAWYLLGKDIDDLQLITFDIERIVSISLCDERYRFPYDFSCNEYFKAFFGMNVESRLPIQPIKIKVKNQSCNLLRTKPLHHSQKEVLADLDFSVFLYNFVPTDDFISEILAMGPDAEVISPLSLRERVKSHIAEMQNLYNQPVCAQSAKA